MKTKLTDLMLPAPVNGGFRMDGYWTWCGSVVKVDGKYHMFASRWPKTLPMHPGWLAKSEVVRAVSDTAAGPYIFEEVVLPERGAEWWDGRATHNPHITKQGDTFVLYYMGSTNPFQDIQEGETFDNNHPLTISARSNKRVGIATSKSVYGPWKRSDTPMLHPRPEYFDNFFTSNPAPCALPDGSVNLVYKTRTYATQPYPKFLHGKMHLGVAQAPCFDGPYKAVKNSPLLTDPKHEIEDPFVWFDEDGFHLIAKDMNGRICGQQFCGVYARSDNGVDWEFEMGAVSYSRDVLWDDGQVRTMGNMERPFILFEEGKPTHMFFATSDGKGLSGFMGASDTWNMCIPLRAE